MQTEILSNSGSPDAPANPDKAPAFLPRKKAAHIESVDVLRGTACLWVVLHHCLGGFKPHGAAFAHPLMFLAFIANFGWLGVNLFLVLSGFCLYLPLIRANEERDTQVNVAKFAKRRALRILPAYYAAILVGCAIILFRDWHHHLPYTASFPSWKSFALHLVMLFNLFPEYSGDYNSAFWSLGLESQLYLVFPLIVFLAARSRMVWVWTGALILTVVVETLIFRRYGVFHSWPSNNIPAVLYNSLPARCVEFITGMYAAALVARPNRQNRFWAAIAAIALVAPCVVYAYYCRFGPFLDSLWSVEFGALIVLVCAVPREIFLNNALLRALTWVGTISYSIYLLHIYVVWTFYIFLENRFNSNLGLILKAPLVMALSIGVAYLFYRLFERPFMPGRPSTDRQAEIAAAVSPAP